MLKEELEAAVKLQEIIKLKNFTSKSHKNVTIINNKSVFCALIMSTSLKFMS